MAARPRQVSDEEILEVAAACFLERGPGVSTQVIADQLSISQAALFKRFNTKEELMLSALLPPERTAPMRWLDDGPAPGPLRPQLATLLEILWKTVSFIVPRISVIHASGMNHDVIMARYKKFPLVGVIEALAGWIDRAQADGRLLGLGHPVDLASAWLGTLQGRALMRFHFDDIAPDQLDDPTYTGFKDEEAYLATVTELIWRAVGVDVSGDTIKERE